MRRIPRDLQGSIQEVDQTQLGMPDWIGAVNIGGTIYMIGGDEEQVIVSNQSVVRVNLKFSNADTKLITGTGDITQVVNRPSRKSPHIAGRCSIVNQSYSVLGWYVIPDEQCRGKRYSLRLKPIGEKNEC